MAGKITRWTLYDCFDKAKPKCLLLIYIAQYFIVPQSAYQLQYEELVALLYC